MFAELRRFSLGEDAESTARNSRASRRMSVGTVKHLHKLEESQPWNIAIRHNSSIENTHGVSNVISNTKYTLLSWLPKSILEQFRRFANMYFLLITILMFIGTYATYLFQSPLDPYSTIITLTIILLATSVKEGLEDLQRARSDKEENTRIVTIVRFDTGSPVEQEIESQLVVAGDIIKMTGKTAVPADLLLIMTSNYADGNQCYIETANIDGETNLKVREAAPGLSPLTSDGVVNSSLFMGSIELEPPNKDIHTFIGALRLESLADRLPLGKENILLRGSIFSNTDWAYGIAIYTGQETKIQMNSRHAASKMSKMEVYLNRAISLVFIAQVILSTISVLSVYMMNLQDYGRLPYVYPDGVDTITVLPLWLSQWFVFFLLYNNFIPTSLYVTIEFVNLGQAYFIGSDINIYDEVLDCPCMVRSSNMSQELGVCSHVFSDKTGTLTRNEMRFVKFVVDDVMYDLDETNVTAEDGITYNSSHVLAKLEADNKHVIISSTEGVVLDIEGNADAAGDSAASTTCSNPQFSKLYDFIRCLTTCHTIVREGDGSYRAESPDELALVEGVGKFKCGLLKRGTTSMVVEMLGKPSNYDILAVNPFNADRKRMSILLKDPETNEHILMCKGADNVMLPLCAIDASTLKSVTKSLLDLACLGLRTLCISSKTLSEEEALAWLAEFKSASHSMEDRSVKVSKIACDIETDMTLLGITAIEDRLQDEVPEVIADLAKAGIVLWMLTGDKEETAINIGRSCNLLLNHTKLFYISQLEDSYDFAAKLHEIYGDISATIGEGTKYIEDGTERDLALVLDGPSFKFFDEDDVEQRKCLLFIGQHCRSVIACRLTPVQKQQLVRFVKIDSVPKATTLAIGDGANDVSMIREADVGVGIFGKEGRQAANNADFAIGQFKFLRRLMLVHGRWNYSRLSKVFLYSMHKNMTYVLTLFWFSYFAALSGTSPYESWIYNGLNFILGLPIIIYGLQDRDLSDKFVLSHPQVYSTGRENAYMTHAAISIWIFNATMYGVILCLVFYYVVGPSFRDVGIYEMGTTVFTGLVIAMQLKVSFMHHQWSYNQALAVAFSVVGMFVYFLLISAALDDFFYVAETLFSTPLFWFFGVFTGPLTAFMTDLVGYYVYFFFWPSKEILYRETEHMAQFKEDLLIKLVPPPAPSPGDVNQHAVHEGYIPIRPKTPKRRRRTNDENISFDDLYNSGFMGKGLIELALSVDGKPCESPSSSSPGSMASSPTSPGSAGKRHSIAGSSAAVTPTPISPSGSSYTDSSSPRTPHSAWGAWGKRNSIS